MFLASLPSSMFAGDLLEARHSAMRRSWTIEKHLALELGNHAGQSEIGK